jgi:hypothetical protein
LKELESAESKEKSDLLWKLKCKPAPSKDVPGPHRKLELSEEYRPSLPIVNPESTKLERLNLKKNVLQKELEKVNKAIQILKRKK